MTQTASRRERAVLLTITPRLEAEGFEVFLHPGGELLPPFMQGYRPDAIAVKPDKKIAIEVKAGGEDEAKRLGPKLQAMFASQKDWELRILYAPPASSDPEIAPESKARIADMLLRLPSLYRQGGAVAALLTGWSAFEAAARRLMPDDFERPQPPSQMLETLASHGAVTPDEADLLRRLGRLRNQAAHGKLDVMMTEVELEQLIAVTRVLLELTEPAGAA